MLRKLGGYVLGATALVACPCHLPLTLPLLMIVLGGTSLGALLTENPPLVFLAAGGYFVAALAGAFLLLGRRASVGAKTREHERYVLGAESHPPSQRSSLSVQCRPQRRRHSQLPDQRP